MEEKCKTYFEYVTRQIFAVVDPTVHYDKLFQSWFLLDTGIVKTRIKDDDGER